MLAFATTGGLSAIPTIALIRWRRAGRANPDFAPPEGAVLRVRSFIFWELVLVPVVLICAAAMARSGAF